MTSIGDARRAVADYVWWGLLAALVVLCWIGVGRLTESITTQFWGTLIAFAGSLLVLTGANGEGGLHYLRLLTAKVTMLGMWGWITFKAWRFAASVDVGDYDLGPMISADFGQVAVWVVVAVASAVVLALVWFGLFDPEVLAVALLLPVWLLFEVVTWKVTGHFTDGDQGWQIIAVAVGVLVNLALALLPIAVLVPDMGSPASSTAVERVASGTARAASTSAQRSSRPQPRVIRDAREAEVAMTEWMQWLGYEDAHRNPVGAEGGSDGGFDIQSMRAIGEVKFRKGPMGRRELQQLHGEAASLGIHGVFFSHGRYAGTGPDWANRDVVRMPLFSFTELNELRPENHYAEALYDAAVNRDASTP